MKQSLVLVVEDHADTRAMVEEVLTRVGCRVISAADGRSARRLLDEEPIDLVILDLNLPDVDGIQLLVDVAATRKLPVIITSGRQSEDDRVLGLHVGADDYLVKPYSPRELGARVQALLRRVGQGAGIETPLQFGDLQIDRRTREVRVAGRAVDLRRKEFDLLATLASEPRRAFSRAELLDLVWDSRPEFQAATTVTEHVRRLRTKLERDPAHPRWVVTVPGVGYRFEP